MPSLLPILVSLSVYFLSLTYYFFSLGESDSDDERTRKLNAIQKKVTFRSSLRKSNF